ncbi:MAG TPA: DUF4382 domain-containing protein [Draconibacterium sp.]|nr:DUF4382 domain-containing protein [Draconibacterium sp.]
MKKTRFLGILLPVLIGMIVFSCEKSVNDQMLQNEKSGTLTIKITDAPFPSDLVAEANIKIDMVTIKKSGLNMNVSNMKSDSTSMSDTTSFIILSEVADSVNLLELSNGVTKILTENEIPAGDYNEIRLHIVNASIKLKDGREFDLKVPSGNASGLKIKINPTLQITEGMFGQILIDFDISRSFKAIGNDHSKNGIKGFHFSPVVRGVNLTLTSGISGIVSDTSNVNIQDAQILLFSGQDTITSALSATDGFYAIIGVPAGTYSMECTHANYDTLKVDNVEVLTGEVTEQNFVLTPTATP